MNVEFGYLLGFIVGFIVDEIIVYIGDLEVLKGFFGLLKIFLLFMNDCRDRIVELCFFVV